MPLVQAALSVALLPFVLKGHARNPANRLFALYLVELTAHGALIFMMRSSPTLAQAYFWENWVFAVVSVPAPVISYHFSLLFTGARVKKRVLGAGYFLAVVFFVLAAMGLVVAGMQRKSYGYAPIGGPMLLPAVLIGYTFTALAAYQLLKASRSAPHPEERNRAAYVSLGLIVSMAGAAFDFLPMLGLPLYPGLVIGNIVFCLLTTVAIVKFHLLDIRIVFRKGMAYLLASAAVAVPYVALIFLLNTLFGQNFPLWANLVLLILLAIALRPWWDRMQRIVDRLFYRGRYDFLRALDAFSQEAHSISNPEQVGASLVGLIEWALQTSGVHLLLRLARGDFHVEASTAKGKPDVTLGSAHPVVRYLQSTGALLRRDEMDSVPLLLSLTGKEKQELDSLGGELFIPLRTKEAGLFGLIILGKKLSGQSYTREDEQVISTVASRMSVELENVRLYAVETDMRRELERQNEEKTAFLHGVAHELKTPLTAIIASSELLEEQLKDSDQEYTGKLLENVLRSGFSLDRRVTELLDFARMQTGKMELQLQPVQLNLATQDAASQLATLFNNRRQSLKIKVSDKLPPVRADRDRLEQVLFNLLSNANKFSPNDSEIVVRAKLHGNKVVVQVEDSAVAITAQEKAKLFMPYYRGEDAEKKTRIPGLGLGLSLSKQLVELHQGEIWVDSVPGKGNVFSFSLPVWDSQATE